MPASGRVPVHFDGLASLVSMLEREHAHLVESGRSAVETGSPIEYMALQELYRPGCIVTATGLGGLGGTLMALRVVDAYYEPMRSLFGGRKYSFNLALEAVVALGGEFVSVQFRHMFEEWTGGRELKQLPFALLQDSQAAGLRARTAKLTALQGREAGGHAYRRYRAGCFFPRVGGGGSRGGASAADRHAAAGRLIVDTRRGLDLGHAPVAAVDDLGAAIAEVTKRLRTVQRALGETQSEQERAERLTSAGLTVWPRLSGNLELLCWPTVVAFSLTIKQWGFVLVEGLQPVPISADAWEQLILPAATKEMLLAMAQSTQRQAGGSPPRYRFRDVVDEKGGGVLFLLYGPPGTGKTLSVEALAASFGRPLYSISFAELGSTVAELEERLTDVLALAAHWGALVLLDEGDALVERRARGQLLLNSMTGVLLRLLETFNGALFITSNRASAFDPAALSRVTLAVRYEPLGAEAKHAVWRNALARVLMYEEGAPRSRADAAALVDETFDLVRLASFAGSGRAVGTIIRLAVGLCQQRRCSLSQGVLDDAVSTWDAFHRDLRGEGVATGWDDVPEGGASEPVSRTMLV